MSEQEFFKKLNKYLQRLKPAVKKEALQKYYNLPDYNLDPIKEANKIYQNLGFNYQVEEEISLFNAINTLIAGFKSHDKNIIQKLLLFLLYLLVLLIIIKIPFIYVRDIIANLFNVIFVNDTIYLIWHLTFELFYALTTIFIFINLFKKKAQSIKKMMK